MGEYALRFAQVGAAGLVIVLVPWFTVFAWLAWRAVKRGGGMGDFVRASLYADCSFLLLIPAAIAILVFSGQYADFVAESGAMAADAPSPAGAAFLGALAAFFWGLFVLPILAGLFGSIYERVRRLAP